jgi:hypothetical protein
MWPSIPLSTPKAPAIVAPEGSEQPERGKDRVAAATSPPPTSPFGKLLGDEQHIQVPEGYALPMVEMRGIVSRYRALSGRFEIRCGMDNNIVKDCGTPEWTSAGRGGSVMLVACGKAAEVGLQQFQR